jgi:hypothetical protein
MSPVALFDLAFGVIECDRGSLIAIELLAVAVHLPRNRKKEIFTTNETEVRVRV